MGACASKPKDVLEGGEDAHKPAGGSMAVNVNTAAAKAPAAAPPPASAATNTAATHKPPSPPAAQQQQHNQKPYANGSPDAGVGSGGSGKQSAFQSGMKKIPSYEFIHRKSQELSMKHLVRWVLGDGWPE